MIFHRNRAEYTDGVIDLVPVHFTPPDPAMGFGREQIWRITLHDSRGEIGQISYRNGESRCIYYFGHIGYHIDEPYRGHHYARRACLLLRDEILLGGKQSAVITCDPDNAASASLPMGVTTTGSPRFSRTSIIPSIAAISFTAPLRTIRRLVPMWTGDFWM